MEKGKTKEYLGRISYIILLGIIVFQIIFYGMLNKKYAELCDKYEELLESSSANHGASTKYICKDCGFTTLNVSEMNQHIQETKHSYTETLNQVTTADGKSVDLTKEMVVQLKTDCEETEYLKHDTFYRVSAVYEDSQTGIVKYQIVIPVPTGIAEISEDSTVFEVISEYTFGPK